MFARITKLTDVMIHGARETQAVPNEVVEVLEQKTDEARIKKADGVEGWICIAAFVPENTLETAFPKNSTTLQLLQKEFGNAPYLSGGVTSVGADCSGLMQTYLWRVRNRLAPRNSRQQRALTQERPFNSAQDGDLVFATEKANGRHHIGLFTQGKIWHSDSERGVVLDDLTKFADGYTIEAVGSL